MRRQWLLFALLFLALPIPAAAQEERPTPVEYRPAQVAVTARFASSTDLLPADRGEIRTAVEQMLARLIGPRWQVNFRREATLLAGRPLDEATLAELPIERLTPADADSAPGLPGTGAVDKLFLVAVTGGDVGFRVAAREWDRISDTLGPIAHREASSRRSLAKAFVAALVAAHRPVARIISDDETSYLVFRGAALTSRADGLLAPETGTLFCPLLHRRDASGALRQIREVPYTYLELTGRDDRRGEIEVHSALLSALGPYRGLVTPWAIAVSPLATETEITLLRESDQVPLAGRRIEIRANPLTPGEEPTEPLETLLTDRSGSVTLGRNPEHPLVWLTIKSGQAALLRIPLAPGAPPTLQLEFGNDQRRLATEGRLAILTGEIIETVAKRATLLAEARGRARDGEFEKARAALDEASQLPEADVFRNRLAAIATGPANAAEQAGHRASAARIRALAAQLGEVIDRYLKKDAIQATRREITGLEEAAASK